MFGNVMSCSVIAVCLAACTAGAQAPGAGEAPVAPVTVNAPSPLVADAVRGLQHPEVAALFRDHWEWWMERAPTWATTLGDHRYDDRLPSGGLADLQAHRQKVREFLQRARAIDRSALDTTERITLDLFIENVVADIESEVCELEAWTISPRQNPMGQYNYLPKQHEIHDAKDAANLLARYRAIPGAMDDAIAHLERGASAGLFANAESVQRTIAMFDRQLEKPVAEWALMEPAGAASRVLGAKAEAFSRELAAIVEGEIKPAYQRYRDFVARRILPGARTGDRVGLVGLPRGRACYAARITEFIGLQRSAEELHDLGMAEIRRINDEMRALGKVLFGTDNLADILGRLRSDPSLYFTSREELMAAAEGALATAKQAMPRAFGITPRADCKVVPIPDYEAPYTTIAYYNPPHYGGSKPGEFFINLHAPETQPRFEIKALTFHEAIPGHHLQIAIAHERDNLPAWRKFSASTAFVEGWALYSERLADELGLYATDLDRMGMLSYDAWRAARLVVDTGIHAMGWTREQAETFMLEHTALAPANITNEVDRYISWPGQALGYKVGQLEILRLREHARAELGAAFTLAGFHDAVLQNGAVSLPVLARQIEDWIAAQKQNN